MADDALRRREILKGAGTTIAAAVGSGFASQANAQATVTRPADLVLKNGKIINVDRNFTIAQSIAIAGDRILAVGADTAMTAYTAPSTRIVDLRGKAAMPGLIDGHAHMDREGLKSV